MTKQLDSQQFLAKLQQEAQAQAKLEERQILPKQLSGLASLVATHSWQVLLLLSLLGALVWQLCL